MHSKVKERQKQSEYSISLENLGSKIQSKVLLSAQCEKDDFSPYYIDISVLPTLTYL